MWKVPTNRGLYPAGIAFFFSAAFFFSEQIGIVTLPPLLSAILAIICFLTGFYFIFAWYSKDRKDRRDEVQNEVHTRFNITIDSKDFVNKDTEQTKVFFDGLRGIVGGKSLMQEKQNERTKKKRVKEIKKK
jgi:hypothetical protein